MHPIVPQGGLGIGQWWLGFGQHGTKRPKQEREKSARQQQLIFKHNPHPPIILQWASTFRQLSAVAFLLAQPK